MIAFFETSQGFRQYRQIVKNAIMRVAWLANGFCLGTAMAEIGQKRTIGLLTSKLPFAD